MPFRTDPRPLENGILSYPGAPARQALARGKPPLERVGHAMALLRGLIPLQVLVLGLPHLNRGSGIPRLTG